MTAGAHRLYYGPFHENIDCTNDPKLFSFYSNSKKKKLKKPENIFAHKKMPPYYAKKMIPPASWDPPDLEADLWTN